MDSKMWYASKTLWVNMIALAATVSAALGVDLGLDAATQSSIAMGVMAIVNIVLRLMTKTAVAVKPNA
jgi:hypothetical protein|tara:strand:- start:936 stop:1139 length:204 start_codon:yes stop_codon:yes gene_type:complete